MKTLLLGLMMVAGFAAQAETGSGFDALSENGQKVARLEHCGGTATLTQQFRSGQVRPVLVIEGVRNCSDLSIDGVQQGDLAFESRSTRRGEVVIFEAPGVNVHVIQVMSNSRKTMDTVRVQSRGSFPQPRPQPWPQPRPQNQNANIVFDFGFIAWMLGDVKSSRLHECRGTVEARVEGNRVTLVFQDVEQCSKFDILRSNGDAVNYPQKNLQRARDGQFSGSFTIPRDLLEGGDNAIKVVVKSNSGAHDDVILIRFLAL